MEEGHKQRVLLTWIGSISRTRDVMNETMLLPWNEPLETNTEPIQKVSRDPM